MALGFCQTKKTQKFWETVQRKEVVGVVFFGRGLEKKVLLYGGMGFCFFFFF